ncbi:hypothetical protein [Sphaerisporangium album]|uniref:hypothetical protein n=1 Tax=Sphaerisporangium album TaxID=509200 RepID=UPI0015F036EF|nr:hypothetical protein [Sphaerisporangium album]
MARNPNQRFIPTAETIEKERRALELRRAGVTFDVIAEKVGYADRSVAKKAIDRALRRTLQPAADGLRELQGDRYDRLLTAFWPKALGGDYHAADRVLKTMAAINELFGLRHSDGIAERQTRMAEEQAAQVLGVLGRVFDRLNLTPEQRALLGRVVPEELAAVAALEADAVLDVEVLDEGQDDEGDS